MRINFDQYLTWSQLDHRPILFYNPECDVWLCYWLGILMTGNQALLHYYNLVMKIPYGNNIRNELDQQAKDIQALGGFDNRINLDYVENITYTQSKLLVNNKKNRDLINLNSPDEIFKIFSKMLSHTE